VLQAAGIRHRAEEAIEITVPPRPLDIADDVIDQTTPGAVGLRVKWKHDGHIERSNTERFW
jgi:hypothetical protein